MARNLQIFVRGVPYSASESELRELCEEFGEVTDVRLPFDYERKRLRGYGFVTVPTTADQTAIVDGLDGREFIGRKLNAEPARPREY